MPQTVHRLVLTALILAAQQEKDVNVNVDFDRLSAVFFSHDDDNVQQPMLPQLLAEMKRGLGDFGTLVPPFQYKQSQQAWLGSPILKELFKRTPTNPQQQAQAQQKA
mmetsp:Transcript_7907/g.10368  ORF Transcript_7907/g.10368 Transcript_7907/m.10368 type:complete len:107 (+) Transcript_7907:151-471(+)